MYQTINFLHSGEFFRFSSSTYGGKCLCLEGGGGCVTLASFDYWGGYNHLHPPCKLNYAYGSIKQPVRTHLEYYLCGINSVLNALSPPINAL